jgi:diadenosine tetraphosphate (Ap4A) HIT family hydrolase
MSDPLAVAAAAIDLDEPVEELPRAGQPGGEACYYCRAPEHGVLWENPHWRALPRHWSPIPGGVLLTSSAHVDALSDLPRERQAEFGVIAAAIESAILSLGAASLVHMYRWGDGCAHFHVHFIGRPAGRAQFRWRNLPFLEHRYPQPGDDERSRAAAAVARHLTAVDLP